MARLGKAFTIVELLMVVMILAIMAAVVVPMATSSHDSQCAAAARMLTADLELAQSVALARQAPTALVFSGDLQSYKVIMATGQSLGDYASLTAIAHPGKPGQSYEISLPGELQLPDVTVNSASFGGASYVLYDTFGSPAAGGSVVLRAGDATLTVTVQPITGAVSVH
ncbi:MAG: GspH/FimT family pseudopilin [Planctomycetes bacterium]|nr:GspH/FimT family pseudopilin [Planctomycetota bacterium]